MAKEKQIEKKDKREEKKADGGDTGGKLIRILGKDIPENKGLLVGLTKVKGISWSLANAICRKVEIRPDKKVGELSKDELKKISDFIANPDIPGFLKNRQGDLDSGEDKHLNGPDLDLRKDFDIKRLRKIKAYRGVRHSVGLPVRGQRTKSNFRRNRKKSGAVGVSGKGKK